MNAHLEPGRHDDGCIERLHKKANAKISDYQASKEKFRRRMNRGDFMKSNKDQSIAQRCGERQKNVQSWEHFSHASYWWTKGFVQKSCEASIFSNVHHQFSRTITTSNHVLNTMLTYDNFQLVATNGLTILYVADYVLLMDYVLTFHKSFTFLSVSPFKCRHLSVTYNALYSENFQIIVEWHFD